MSHLSYLSRLKAGRQRINAFQCFCLRQILHIAPSYFSRVSNVSVLERSGQILLSALLKQRQVRSYKKIQAASLSDFVRQLVCDINGVPIKWYIRRRRGRPRQRWAESVFHLVNNDMNYFPFDVRSNRVNARTHQTIANVPFFHLSTDTWW